MEDPGPGKIKLYFAAPISGNDGTWLSDAISALSVDEIERANRFHFEADRLRFISGRALLRRSLSRFRDFDPSGWRFYSNQHGRPEIAEPLEGRELRFSLSYTDGLAMCAVAVGREIGADIERVRPYPADVVESFFSKKEANAIATAPERDRSALFFTFWTLKEAYCKAKGTGLPMPLDKVSFALANTGACLTINSPFDDDSESWGFRIIRPACGYVAAVCADITQEPLITIEVEEAEEEHLHLRGRR